jgi:hypothetical protein
MIARRLIVLFVVAGALGASVQAQERCGVGKDLIMQTLERVHPGSDASRMQDGVELLKHAISTCPTLGDAWYYRSLLERALGNARLADYALTKAQDNNSEAYRQKLDPFTLSTKPNAPPAGPVRDKWALVVGISTFKQPEIDKLGITFTTTDALEFAELLKNPGVGRFKPDHVITLKDKGATTVAIKEKLNLLARMAGPDDLVVVYFATHGSSRDMDTAKASYIVTYDTQVGPNLDDQDLLFATGLGMAEVASAVASRVKAQRTVIVLDTCYSGGAAGGRNGLLTPGSAMPNDTLDLMKQGTGRVVLSASQGDEEAIADKALSGGHGLFTYYLMDALKRSHGLDPVGKIFPNVQQQVSARARSLHATQVPAMAQSDEGDQIVIGAAVAGGATMGQ